MMTLLPSTRKLPDDRTSEAASLSVGQRIPSISLRMASVGIACALFAVVALVAVLTLRQEQHRIAVLFSVLGAVVVLAAFYLLLSLFERQQEKITLQSREIETLHAMDTAIVRELDLPRLLEVAVRNAVRAVDGEAGGIALFHPGTGKLVAEELTAVGLNEAESDRLRHITRSGTAVDEDLWETLIVPLMVGNDIARIVETAVEEFPDSKAVSEPTGYLMAARRRQATHVFTETDRALLLALSNTVDVAVANVRALEAARESVQVKNELARERRVAQVLTEGLLPDIPAHVGRWHFAKRYEAQGDEALVGGDIYDLFPLGAGQWGIVIADVSGKGLAAAKKTAMVKYSLRSYAREHDSPGRVLARLNAALFDEPALTGFVTLWYGVLDENTGIVRYASAGHETPILQRADGHYEMLESTGLVLGAAPDQEYDTEQITLNPGDGLLLFTDGLTEARSQESGALLEIDGVLGILGAKRQRPTVLTVPDAIWEAVTEYTGGKMRDDTALLWLQCTGPAESERA